MAEFSIADLTRLLRAWAGVDEDVDVDLEGDIIDCTFDELGYDSLALLNTVDRINRELSIKLPDEALSEAKTPRQLLAQINDVIRRSARFRV